MNILSSNKIIANHLKKIEIIENHLNELHHWDYVDFLIKTLQDPRVNKTTRQTMLLSCTIKSGSNKWCSKNKDGGQKLMINIVTLLRADISFCVNFQKLLKVVIPISKQM